MRTIQERIRFWIQDINKLGFYHILTVNTISSIFGFASQLFVLGILTSEEIGQIRIMQSFLTYAVLIGGLGFNSSTLKLCSEKRPLGEIVYLYKKSLVYSGTLSVMTLIIFLILNSSGLLIQNKDFVKPLNLLLISVLPLVINALDSVYLQSRQEFKKLSKIQLSFRVISIILIISLTYIFGFYGFIIANIIGNIISFFVLFHTVNKINKGIKAIKLDNSFNLHFKFSILAFLANLCYQASVYFDMILMNYIVKDDLKGIGSYGAATLVISFFSLTIISFQQVLTPSFSNISWNLIEWEKLLKKYSKIFFISVSTLGVVSLLSLPYILDMVFGKKFEKIGLFFSILLIAWFFKSLISVKSAALFGLGKIKIIFTNSLLVVIIALPLNYFMIYKYGVIGAGIANIITSIFILVIYNISFSLVLKKWVISLKHESQ